jgi:hypothetical protein
LCEKKHAAFNILTPVAPSLEPLETKETIPSFSEWIVASRLEAAPEILGIVGMFNRHRKEAYTEGTGLWRQWQP